MGNTSSTTEPQQLQRHSASYRGDLTRVQQLLYQGFDIDADGGLKTGTSLMQAVLCGHVNVINNGSPALAGWWLGGGQCVIEGDGGSAKIRNGKIGATIHRACLHGHFNAVNQYLVENHGFKEGNSTPAYHGIHGSPDGSIKNGRCSFSWTLACTSFPGSSRITAHALEDPSDPSTARVEALGHLGALYFIRSISRFLRIPPEALATSKVHAFIDNMDVIHRLRNPSYKSLKSALAADFDVTNEICLVLSELSTSILRHHVKSHEHDDELLEDLPLPAKLNRVRDIACEAAYSCPACSVIPPPPLSLPSTRCALIISGRCYTGKSRDFLRRQVSQLETKSYILEQEGWNLALFDSVSWDSLDTATTRCKGTHRTVVVKLQFRLWATLTYRKRRGEPSLDTRCPRCPIFHTEDFDHILCCSAPEAISDRTDAFSTLAGFF